MKLEALKLRKTFKDADKNLAIIEDLSFSFPEKGSIAIVGRSGVGKSTLLYLLAGLDVPDSGNIKFDNIDLASLDSEKLTIFRGMNIGFIFQFHHLLSDFTALENVAMPLFISGVNDNLAIERARQVLMQVGLKDRMTHSPGELSGGEQQRVAIARAVVAKPSVILADEPTGNLDVKTAEEVGRILIDVQKQSENLLVVVTHSKELARSMDYVYEMLPGGQLISV
ncbi:MAG: ABC transporter ATP-binding protein [bacterium]|nr:ABC transporter ATP-binding protein [bacterium]